MHFEAECAPLDPKEPPPPGTVARVRLQSQKWGSGLNALLVEPRQHAGFRVGRQSEPGIWRDVRGWALGDI